MNEQNGILIEMYLDGALEGEALSAFEDRLRREPELSNALEERKQWHQFLQHQDQRETLKGSLSQISEKHFQPEAKVRSLFQKNAFRIGSIAAAIALLLLLWQPWDRPSLYQQYAQHQPLALAERGDDALDPTAIEKAFAQKHYTTAIPLLRTFLQSYPDATEASLYLGICYLETNNFQASDAIFKSIAEGQSSFKYDGQWYLALSALKQNDLEKARSYLQLIPEDSRYFQKAKSLLVEIAKAK